MSGWRKLPEEKPKEVGAYIVSCGDTIKLARYDGNQFYYFGSDDPYGSFTPIMMVGSPLSVDDIEEIMERKFDMYVKYYIPLHEWLNTHKWRKRRNTIGAWLHLYGTEDHLEITDVNSIYGLWMKLPEIPKEV